MSSCLVSINPDLRSAAGHGLYLDRELAREAALLNWQFQSWGHDDLPPQLLAENPWLRPVFRDTSHHATVHDQAHRERFFHDLLKWCEAPENRNSQLVLFVYTGHVSQLAAFWRLLERIGGDRLRVVFNLYAANWDFEESAERFQSHAENLRRTLGPGAHLVDRQRFIMTSDSSLLAQLAERSWGVEVPVLPFFSMARSRHTSDETPTPIDSSPETLTVAYPSSVHRQRGFQAFPQMVEHCRSHSRKRLRFVFRTCLAEDNLSVEEMEICRQLRALDCELIYGSLSEEEMKRFYSGADIILNPYPVRYFKDRTSGNVADALSFGKPVIAARGTWAGRLIEKLECGESFEDEDGVSMAEAVMKVADDLATYSLNATLRGGTWAHENNVGVLLRRIQSLAGEPPQPCRIAMKSVEEWRETLFHLIDSSTHPRPGAHDGPENVPAIAPAPASTPCLDSGTTCAPTNYPAPLGWRKIEKRMASLKTENARMKRAIEHFRASPIRALRLWFYRKKRQLWL